MFATTNQVVYSGKLTEDEHGGGILEVENDEGKVFLQVSTGRLFPTNWVGCRVTVTMRLEESQDGNGKG